MSWRSQEEGQVGKVGLGPKNGEVQYCSCFSFVESASTGMECMLGQGGGVLHVSQKGYHDISIWGILASGLVLMCSIP